MFSGLTNLGIMTAGILGLCFFGASVVKKHTHNHCAPSLRIRKASADMRGLCIKGNACSLQGSKHCREHRATNNQPS